MDMHLKIDKSTLPQHVAIIMDGNGRWAKQRRKMRVFGHQNAIKAVRDTVEGAAEIGIKYLTLYAFSTENWNRPKFEITALMELLVSSLSKELKTLNKNNIRLLTIGNTDSLPKKCRKELQNASDNTAGNTHMNLVLALSYSSRWEIVNAVKQVINQGISAEELTENTFQKHFSTADIPDPELMIRTSGEYRISNFLLWQLAYTELYFTDKLWPDFRKEDLFEAIVDYQKRERRFGMTGEQIASN
ncbi:MAG: isoprenyl transferase [Flavobacteriales bacterium]|nr:MAG: isoprenyl transferase [Flavobacteriales bacterium]